MFKIETNKAQRREEVEVSGRLDSEMVARGLFATRSKAQSAIRDGLVLVDGIACDKPGRKVSDSNVLEVSGRVLPYVSRGGLKLERAIETWDIDLSGACVLDIGSSTGGFTDCALMHGASRVIAVDVGTDQMVEPLRSDPRIELYEQTDFRLLDHELLRDVTVATIDVSFVSATLMVEKLSALPSLHHVVCLVKPQFECGASAAKAHKGVIRDERLRAEAVDKVRGAFEEAGFACSGVVESPITGGDGNVEFLAHFVR